MEKRTSSITNFGLDFNQTMKRFDVKNYNQDMNISLKSAVINNFDPDYKYAMTPALKGMVGVTTGGYGSYTGTLALNTNANTYSKNNFEGGSLNGHDYVWYGNGEMPNPYYAGSGFPGDTSGQNPNYLYVPGRNDYPHRREPQDWFRTPVLPEPGQSIVLNTGIAGGSIGTNYITTGKKRETRDFYTGDGNSGSLDPFINPPPVATNRGQPDNFSHPLAIGRANAGVLLRPNICKNVNPATGFFNYQSLAPSDAEMLDTSNGFRAWAISAAMQWDWQFNSPICPGMRFAELGDIQRPDYGNFHPDDHTGLPELLAFTEANKDVGKFDAEGVKRENIKTLPLQGTLRSFPWTEVSVNWNGSFYIGGQGEYVARLPFPQPISTSSPGANVYYDDSYWTGTCKDPLNYHDPVWEEFIDYPKLKLYLAEHPGCVLG